MNKGVLIFAHNNREIDYALMATVAGGLAKKNLKVPVSLATDESTIDWMKESNIYSKAQEVFEHIIIVDRPDADNTRKLHDGTSNVVVPFNNGNRCSVWDITPYDRTLMIDCDFLIFSNQIGEYWDIDEDIIISQSYNDILGNRIGYHDRYVSDTGIKLYWATMVMFTKNSETKKFFDLIEYVRDNYKVLADLYRFDDRIYRNDISFSVAKHIFNGFEEGTGIELPPVLSIPDKDILHSVEKDRLVFLSSPNVNEKFIALSTNGVDVHIMNKKSIVRNIDALMELI